MVAIIAVVGVYQWPVAITPWVFLLPMMVCVRAFPGRWLVVMALASAAWASVCIDNHTARVWPAAADGSVRAVSGRVVGLPEVLSHRTRFMLETEDGRRLRLSWYRDAPSLAPGDRVVGRAKLDTPHGSANPGTFDYESWLWRKRIHATGYIKQARRCGDEGEWLIDRVRLDLKRRLDAALVDSTMRGIIEALALGVRGGISDAQWQTLRRTGTSHVVAISGLHIGLISGWLFFLIRWLVLRLPGRARADVLAAAGALVGAFGYATLAGWALPTERAVVMVAVALAGVVFMRDVSRSRLLAIAAVIVLALQPAAVIGPGFWLSFGAVAWILYLIRPGTGSRWKRAAIIQCGLVLGLMPLTLWYFGQASLVAPVVNAVVIPLAVVLVPAVLLASVAVWTLPVVGTPLIHVLASALAVGWSGLAWIGSGSIASIHLAIASPATLILAVIGLVWLWAPRGVPARWLGLLILLPAVVGWHASGAGLAPGEYRLTVLDVGQGSANVIQTRHHTLVFDAGPAFGKSFDAGRMIVVPYLRRRGIGRIDALVLSHSDQDHAGGGPAIRAAVPVDVRRGANSAHPCIAGQRWRWDGVDFVFVYPTADEAKHADNDNARSCVLRVQGAGGTTLLTGDIESPQESRLLARQPALAADVLVVAHHGSATSTSAAFVDQVAPAVALISAGWHNRWHFPADKVVDRLSQSGARIIDTATAGAITVRVGKSIHISRWRAVRRRLWQRPRVRTAL